jgi:phosphoglycerate kinase
VNDSTKPASATESDDPFGTLEELECRGRLVFLRTDPHVISALPAVAARCADDEKTGQPAPSTLHRLLELGARVVIGTSLDAKLAAETGMADIEALGRVMSERLQIEVLIPDACVGDAATLIKSDLRDGQVCLLPDLSADPGELDNDDSFARGLSASIDSYVGDAFAASHLEHASVTRLPRLVPRRALGLHARRELRELGRLSSSAERFALLLGGQRFSDKVELLDALLPRLSTLCVGGGVASTLLLAAGGGPPGELAEPDRAAQARSLLSRARSLGVKVNLPVDQRFVRSGAAEVVAGKQTVAGGRLVDVGPETCEVFAQALRAERSLLWWGPLGNLEAADGKESSRVMAALAAEPARSSAVMGGSIGRFLRAQTDSVRSGIDLISTGSDSAQRLLLGRRLVGLETLRKAR